MEHFWRNTVFTLIVISKYQTSVLDFKDVNTFSFRRHPFKGDTILARKSGDFIVFQKILKNITDTAQKKLYQLFDVYLTSASERFLRILNILQNVWISPDN